MAGRHLNIFCCLTIVVTALGHGLSASAGMIHARDITEGTTSVLQPDVQFIASRNRSTRSNGIDLDSILIHTTEVSYERTLISFLSPSSQVSAHFVIAPDGHIVQMVDTALKAWHATYYNSRSIGIEMVGFANVSATWNENNLSALTDLLAWLVTAYDVPLVHPIGDALDTADERFDQPGLVAHGQVQPWNRTDPGPHFPWESVLADTQQKIDAAPEPGTVAIMFLACGARMTRRRG